MVLEHLYRWAVVIVTDEKAGTVVTAVGCIYPLECRMPSTTSYNWVMDSDVVDLLFFAFFDRLMSFN
jgi:hypothetical protein